MKWITATGLLTLTGLATIGGRAMLSSGDMAPDEIVAQVRLDMQVPGYDQRQAIRQLERTFLHASVREDADLATEVLGLQADIYRQLGAHAEARDALERIQNQYRPDSRELKLEIANLRALDGYPRAALIQVKELLKDAPDFGPAWRLRGRLEVLYGKQILAEAEDIARRVLVSDDALEAVLILRELSARDPSDSGRIQAAHNLRELFMPRNEEKLKEARGLVDKASEIWAEARASYSHAFENEIDPVGAREYVELLVTAGRPDLAIEFGEAAIALPVIHADPAFRVTLLGALELQGHLDRAAALAGEWQYRRDGAPSELAEAAMRLMAKTRKWGRLASAANTLRSTGTESEENLAFFFLGKRSFAQAQRSVLTDEKRAVGLKNAIRELGFYLASGIEEPYPGADAEAYFTTARAFRGLGNEDKELEFLTKSIQDYPWMDGEAYLRVVELQTSRAKNSGYGIPEIRWTIAMAMLPERTDELFARWVELGEASLLSSQQDFEKMFNRMLLRSAALPVADVGPQTMYKVSRRHLERGSFLASVRISRMLLARFPGLLPALDTLIEALIARDQGRQAIEYIIDRLALVGADEKVRAYLAQIDPEDFTEDQVLRSMRADPSGLGRSTVVRFLIDSGQPERAWRALAIEDHLGEDPALQLLKGETLIQLGRFDEAAARLGDQGGGLDGRLLETVIEARLGAGEFELVSAVVDTLVEEAEPDREGILAVVDQLLLGSRFADAGRLLRRLDSEPELRGSDVLSRLALQAALTGDRERAEETLERAEAFYDDGSIEKVRIFFAIEDHEWTRLPELVAHLRETGFEPTPLEDAILALLEERLEAGSQMAETGRRENPYSPDWLLVHGAASLLVDGPIASGPYFGSHAANDTHVVLRGGDKVSRDPREILGLLLAIDHGSWAIWATPRVFRLFQEQGGITWPAYLSARLFENLGERDTARSGLERLTKKLPDFGPAWDTLLEILYEEYPDDPYHEDILAARVARLRAMGDALQDDDLAMTIDAASELVLDGEFAQAANRIQAALDKMDGTTNYGRALLGRLYALDGKYKRAVVEYDRASEDLEQASDHPLVEEFLDVLHRASLGNARGAERLSSERIKAYLDRLQTRFPEDPLIPLARTRIEVAGDPRNPDLFVTRANFNLRELRDRTQGRALNTLRAGAAEQWISYLLELDPGLAEELIREDLSHSPGDLDLWLLLALTTERRGDMEEAMQLHGAIVGMSDDPNGRLGYARLLADSGRGLADVEGHLASVRASGSDLPPAMGAYIQATAMLHDEDPDLREVISILERLWTVRAQFASEIEPYGLGRTYITALFLRISSTTAWLERVDRITAFLDEATEAPQAETDEQQKETDEQQKEIDKQQREIERQRRELDTLQAELAQLPPAAREADFDRLGVLLEEIRPHSAIDPYAGDFLRSLGALIDHRRMAVMESGVEPK